MTSIAASSSPRPSPADAAGCDDTIARVSVRAVKVPMPEPHRTASGVITESPLVLVDLETTQGVVGHSFVFTYTAAALQPVATLVENLEALVKGRRLEPAAISRALLARFRLLGTHGLVGMAISAIDMAAWDALARARGLPLCELLGAAQRPTPAYGEAGVTKCLEIIANELDLTMAFCGRTDIRTIDRDILLPGTIPSAL